MFRCARAQRTRWSMTCRRSFSLANDIAAKNPHPAGLLLTPLSVLTLIPVSGTTSGLGESHLHAASGT